jgi:hypothetical protein
MFGRRPRHSSLIAEITKDCEYLLVEAAIGFAKDREWTVRGFLGRKHRVVLTVDEWTDSPLIEVRDPDTGEVVKLIEITIMCWPRPEDDRGEPFRR